jgi:hypothetical protein
MHVRGKGRIMKSTYNTKTKRLIATWGVGAAASVAPALLFAGAGTAHADDPCYGSLQGSYYCYANTPLQTPEQLEPAYTPVQPAFGYSALPQCSGGPLAAISGALSGDGCT